MIRSWKYTLISLVALMSQMAVADEIKGETQVPALAKAVGTVALMVEGISSESNDKMSIATIKLNSKPDMPNVDLEDHSSFLQIRLPNTITAESGRFYDGSGPYIAKIAAYQVNPTDTIIRLFLTKSATAIKEATDAQILNKRIVVTIDHNAARKADHVAETIAAKIPTEVPSSAPPVAATLPVTASSAALEKVEANTLPTAPVPPVAEKIENAKDDAVNISSLSNLDKKLNMLALASLIFFVLFFGFMTLRRIYRGRRAGTLSKDVITMQVLHNLAISPKQRLSLVQVGNERLLLAISPDQVSLISTIANPEVSRMPAMQPMHSPSAPAITQSQAPRKMMAPPPPAPRVAAPRPVAQTHTPSAEAAVEPKINPRKINYAISDDGITELKVPGRAGKQNSNQAIDDVTKMIREKLKNLPKLP